MPAIKAIFFILLAGILPAILAFPEAWPFALLYLILPHILVVILVLAMLALWRRRYWVLVACVPAAAMAVSQLWPLPSTPLQQTAEDGPTVTIASLNLWKHNPEPIESLQTLLDLQADIIMLCEIKPELWQMLEPMIQEEYASYHRSWNGVVIATDLEVKEYIQPHTAFHDTFLEGPGFLHARAAMPNGQPVELLAVHTSSSRNQRNVDRRSRQLEKVAAYVTDLPNPVILGGDLNSPFWDDIFRQFLQTSNLQLPADIPIFMGSWPVDLPPWLRTRLDYILGKNVDIIEFSNGPEMRSDHLPVVATVRLPMK